MRNSDVKRGSSNQFRLLAAVLAMGLSAVSGMTAHAEGPQRAYDDSDARVRAVQYSLDRDQTDLEAARRRVDAITAAREKQLNDLSVLRAGGDDQVNRAKADLDKATRDQTRLRDQMLAIQKSTEAANAKLEPIHAAALGKFESTDSFKSSFATFDKSRQELKVPTDAALDQLAQTREFQDLVAGARTAKTTADKLHDDKTADAKAVAAADDAFITADNKVQDLEEKALTSDPKIVEGRKRVDEAQATLRQMRDQMEQDLLKDPAYVASVDEMHRQQAALDAATGEMKKLDAQVADLRAAVDKQPTAPQDNRAALGEAEGRLDTINSDLAQARQEAAKFESRVQEDQDGLNHARRDRESVYSPPVYYGPIYSAPAYYGPGYYSGTEVSIGFGYYPGYYDSGYYGNHYYSNHYYYNRYYYGDRGDWRDRDRDRTRYQHEDRSDDRHESRQPRSIVDRRTSQDNVGARTSRDVHATPTGNDEPRRSTRSETPARDPVVRVPEDVHGRRVTETPGRSDPRAPQEPSRPARNAHADAPAPRKAPKDQDAPRQQETPRHQDAPRQQEAPRQHDAPKSDHSSSSGDSSDSTSRSHMKSR